MKYYTDSQAIYADLCRHIGVAPPPSAAASPTSASIGGPGGSTPSGGGDDSGAELKLSIQQRLAEIRTLSITADDQAP